MKPVFGYGIVFNSVGLLFAVLLLLFLQTTPRAVRHFQLLRGTAAIAATSQILMLTRNVFHYLDLYDSEAMLDAVLYYGGVVFGRLSILFLILVSLEILRCFAPLSPWLSTNKIVDRLKRIGCLAFFFCCCPALAVRWLCLGLFPGATNIVGIADVAISNLFILCAILYDTWESCYVAHLIFKWNQTRQRDKLTQKYLRVLVAIIACSIMDWCGIGVAIMLSIKNTDDDLSQVLGCFSFSIPSVHAVIMTAVFLKLKELTFFGNKKVKSRQKPTRASSKQPITQGPPSSAGLSPTVRIDEPKSQQETRS